jgi:hypothetical protein
MLRREPPAFWTKVRRITLPPHGPAHRFAIGRLPAHASLATGATHVDLIEARMRRFRSDGIGFTSPDVKTVVPDYHDSSNNESSRASRLISAGFCSSFNAYRTSAIQESAVIFCAVRDT